MGKRLDRCALVLVSWCAIWTSFPNDAAAESPCADETCSGHGTCVYEGARPYCFCDEAYAAEGLACTPSSETPERIGERSVSRAIVDIARREVGRELPSVGLDRPGYPHALGSYIAEDALWCSDFVSWVYRAAGVPLTGGYEGGWLVTNNTAMRRWFERRRRWVPASSPRFATFDPAPGDYVRIQTPTWGHSAIVDHVEGNTLHIIEGNAQGHVRTNRYRDFRHHPKIGGFGIVTRPRARRVWRPLLPSHWMPVLRSR